MDDFGFECFAQAAFGCKKRQRIGITGSFTLLLMTCGKDSVLPRIKRKAIGLVSSYLSD